MFDTVRVLSAHEIESMRRSVAMSPLSIDDQRTLVDACAEMAAPLAQIAPRSPTCRRREGPVRGR